MSNLTHTAVITHSTASGTRKGKVRVRVLKNTIVTEQGRKFSLEGREMGVTYPQWSLDVSTLTAI